MDIALFLSNLRNPTLLFFVLGIVARRMKSDLEIPAASVKFISLYLLFSIGFKGGQELAHAPWSAEIGYALIAGIVLATLIPCYAFFIIKRKLPTADSAAIAAAYGSVSAVTFVTASSYLDQQQLSFGGHMVAVMALMESPAILVGVILMRAYDRASSSHPSLRSVVTHAFTNGSVVMIMGSMIIGLLADARQAEGIRPFTTDIFKGFLAIFLLEMGMVTASGLKHFSRNGLFVVLLAIALPLVNGCMAAWASGMITQVPGDRFMLAILAASASYIAVPAAMRHAAPTADPSLYISMALGVTFPFNITVGMPVYMQIIRSL
jgi:hypothetical protein